ncbi:MAG: GAF domain-containing protein [Chloroflexi bacterium]|nr:MAG: GAF domain-containing protein [Chloroflexota bacterium]
MDGEVERKLKELSFLHEVAQVASSTLDWDEMLRQIIDRTTTAMEAQVCSLYLLDKREGVLTLAASNGLNRRAIGRAKMVIGEGITGWVAKARVPLASRDVRSEPRFKWVPGVDEDRFTSMLSAPLVAGDETVGVINIQTVRPRDFTPSEIEYLQTIANQLAGIIQKSRLQRDAERKLHEVTALFEVSNVLTSTLKLEEVLVLSLDRILGLYPGSSGAIYLGSEPDFEQRATRGDPPKALRTQALDALARLRAVVEGQLVAQPLLVGDQVLGAIALHVPGKSEWTDEDLNFIAAVANQAALAIDKAALYEVERRTSDRLRELDRARSEFVSMVTHDLRTPLSVIRGYLDLIGENGNRAPIGDALSQVQRLDDLVDRILTSVRAASPELQLRRSRFDLRGAVAESLRELAPIMRRHRLEAQLPSGALFVRGDRRRVQEVVANLLHNAAKYAPEATRVTVRVRRQRGDAVVSVGDEGPGVPLEDRGRIFEPYVRVGDPTRVRGTGIGLYASRRIVEAHGGRIWLEGREPAGATFSFTLPLASAAA